MQSLAKRVRAPLQERSQRTLDRVLAATEALLATRRFAEIPVADIVARAGTSVGAFYARFTDKDALLPLIYERYDRDLRRRLEREFADARWRDLDLGARIDEAVALTVRMFRERRGILRAMAIYARTRPQAIPAEVRSARARMMDSFVAILLERRDEIRHPEPEDAARLGLFAVAAICRDKILFNEAPHSSTVPIDDGRLARELARMLRGYLGCPTPTGPSPARPSRASASQGAPRP